MRKKFYYGELRYLLISNVHFMNYFFLKKKWSNHRKVRDTQILKIRWGYLFIQQHIILKKV